MPKIPSTYIGTNMEAFFDTEAIKATHKSIAQREAHYHSAGQKPGVEIWRINKFQLEVVPDIRDPVFFRGDCYLALHTLDASNKASMTVYYWIGRDCSTDEKATVALKAVELDDFFDTEPRQCRLVDGHEAPAFLKLFNSFTAVEGGVDTGFRSATREALPPRLLRVKGQSPVTVREVPRLASSLNAGDTFVLDSGERMVYQWNGRQSHVRERRRAMEVAQGVVSSRGCRSQVFRQGGEADAFWELLEGTADDVLAAEAVESDAAVSASVGGVDLFRLSDETGQLVITHEYDGSQGRPLRSSLVGGDVMLVLPRDGWQLTVWVGPDVSREERRAALLVGEKFLEEQGKAELGVLVVPAGTEDSAFWDQFEA